MKKKRPNKFLSFFTERKFERKKLNEKFSLPVTLHLSIVGNREKEQKLVERDHLK